MEAESVHVGATGVIGTVVAVLGYFGKRAQNQIDENTRAISEHRVEDANKYATNADVKESLGRVHDRIDEVAQDIKTLLSRHA